MFVKFRGQTDYLTTRKGDENDKEEGSVFFGQNSPLPKSASSGTI